MRIQIHIAVVHAIMRIDLRQFLIARIFDAIDMVSPQKLDEQMIQILGSRTDHDLFRQNTHTAKMIQMVRDRLTQFIDTLRWRRQKHILRLAT